MVLQTVWRLKLQKIVIIAAFKAFLAHKLTSEAFFHRKKQ